MKRKAADGLPSPCKRRGMIGARKISLCLYCCAGVRCVRHRSIVPQPLPIPLPFPSIFSPQQSIVSLPAQNGASHSLTTKAPDEGEGACLDRPNGMTVMDAGFMSSVPGMQEEAVAQRRCMQHPGALVWRACLCSHGCASLPPLGRLRGRNCTPLRVREVTLPPDDPAMVTLAYPGKC